jgi:MFS family permease
VPPAIGRMVGPLFGGAIVTVTSWRWIFLVNVPFGLLGIVLAWLFVRDVHETKVLPAFDFIGFALLALGLTGMLGGLETTDKALIAAWVSWTCAGLGLAALVAYVVRSRAMASPIIDLRVLRYRTYHASIIGGTPLRVAIGASPFLLPLMFQLGFGLSPLDSGLLTVATAVGSLATRTIMTRTIRLIGFRSLLLAMTALTSLCYMSYSLFAPTTPHVVIFLALMFGGLVNSMGMVSLQTLGFSEIPKPLMSHATALSTMAQQVSLSFGVVLAASLVSAAAWLHGSDNHHLAPRDFAPAFVAIGLMTLTSLLYFRRLSPEEGAELRA